MTTDALAIVFSPNLLRAPHNDFLMIMSNMQHTNKLVKALVTHVCVLEPTLRRVAHINLVVYSSTLSSTMRMRTGRRIKSTKTTNLTNPLLRKTKRWKQTQARHMPSESFRLLRGFAISVLHLKMHLTVPNSHPSPQVFHSVYFTLITFVPFSRSMLYLYCNFGHCNPFIRSRGFLHTWHRTSYHHHLSCYFLSVCL